MQERQSDDEASVQRDAPEVEHSAAVAQEAAVARRRRIADLIIVLLVPAILAGVAVHQMWLANTSDLTAWKGGGFGMFASSDRPSHRAVRGHFHTLEDSFAIDMYTLNEEVDRAGRKAFVNARALPDARRVDRWAEQVLAAGWQVNSSDVAVFSEMAQESGPPVPLLRDADSSGVMVVELTIEVWATSYDRDTKEIAPVLLAEHRYPVGLSP